MPKCEQCRSWPRCRNFFGDEFRNNTTCDWVPSNFAYSSTYVQGLEKTIEGLTANNTRLTAERVAAEAEYDTKAAQVATLKKDVSNWQDKEHIAIEFYKAAIGRAEYAEKRVKNFEAALIECAAGCDGDALSDATRAMLLSLGKEPDHA